MANEIRTTQTLTVTKGNLRIKKTVSLNAALTEARQSSETASLTTAVTVLLKPETDTVGAAWFSNLSTTEWIEIGSIDAPEYGGNFAPFLNLPPLGEQTVYLADITVAARTLSGVAPLDYQLVAR